MAYKKLVDPVQIGSMDIVEVKHLNERLAKQLSDEHSALESQLKARSRGR